MVSRCASSLRWLTAGVQCQSKARRKHKACHDAVPVFRAARGSRSSSSCSETLRASPLMGTCGGRSPCEEPLCREGVRDINQDGDSRHEGAREEQKKRAALDKPPSKLASEPAGRSVCIGQETRGGRGGALDI